MANQEMFNIDDIDSLLFRVANNLEGKFKGIFSIETVERYVRESYGLLAESAAVKTHLPALTERFARDRLTALAQ